MNVPLSVVIRTYNSGRTLEKVLSGLHFSSIDQIIIVDSGSSDNTLAIANSFHCEILTLPFSSFSYGKALNVGFFKARNEWILSLSSHCIPFTVEYLDSYRKTISRFQKNIGCLIAPMVYCQEDWYLKKGLTFFTKEKLSDHIPGGNTNALYLKSAWEKHPFDEKLLGAEDHEWILWAADHGYEIAMAHNVPVLYQPNRSLKNSFFKGRWNYSVPNKTSDRLFNHDPLWWFSLNFLKLVLGRIDPKLFLHIVAQRAGALTHHWEESKKSDEKS